MNTFAKAPAPRNLSGVSAESVRRDRRSERCTVFVSGGRPPLGEDEWTDQRTLLWLGLEAALQVAAWLPAHRGLRCEELSSCESEIFVEYDGRPVIGEPLQDLAHSDELTNGRRWAGKQGSTSARST